jgi:predicted alpha/beta hydrolase family esterase
VGTASTPEPQRFLVLHGLDNHRPAGHWQRRLVGELRHRGAQVLYPQLPDAASPSLTAWLDALTDELQLVDEAGGGELVVVAHSLGAVLWLHACAAGIPVRPDRVLLVAPAGPAELTGAAPTFALRPSDGGVGADHVRAAADDTVLVWSGADPWCAEGADTVFGDPLGLRTVVVPGSRHFALDDGFGPWPDVVRWCLDPTSVWT